MWTNSLSMAVAKIPEDKITKEGTNKQCTTQASDKLIANLSDLSWASIDKRGVQV